MYEWGQPSHIRLWTTLFPWELQPIGGWFQWGAGDFTLWCLYCCLVPWSAASGGIITWWSLRKSSVLGSSYQLTGYELIVIDSYLRLRSSPLVFVIVSFDWLSCWSSLSCILRQSFLLDSKIDFISFIFLTRSDWDIWVIIPYSESSIHIKITE